MAVNLGDGAECERLEVGLAQQPLFNQLMGLGHHTGLIGHIPRAISELNIALSVALNELILLIKATAGSRSSASQPK